MKIFESKFLFYETKILYSDYSCNLWELHEPVIEETYSSHSRLQTIPSLPSIGSERNFLIFALKNLFTSTLAGGLCEDHRPSN